MRSIAVKRQLPTSYLEIDAYGQRKGARGGAPSSLIADAMKGERYAE